MPRRTHWSRRSAARARWPGISVNPGISTTDQRQQGFEQELKKYPKVKYLGTQYCNDDQTKATNMTSALLAGHPNLKGVFAMNVVSGNGVTAAVKTKGLSGKVKLVEFDAGPPQVQALKSGTIDALIAQYPYGIGQQGVQLAVPVPDEGQGRDQAALRHRLGDHHARERQLARDEEVPLHAVAMHGRQETDGPRDNRGLSAPALCVGESLVDLICERPDEPN